MTYKRKYAKGRRSSKDSFKSDFEREGAKGLNALKRRFRFKWEYEPEEIEYTITKKYVPDFVVELKDNRKVYIEFKGYLDYKEQVKLLAIKQVLPDIKVVFAKDNKLPGRKLKRYSDWAREHNIDFAIKEIPFEWFT